MSWQLLAVLLSLGLDNLVLSVALGASNVRSKRRLALTFALFEGLMSLLGFLLGRTLGGVIGAWGEVLGMAALLGLGVYVLMSDDDDDDKVKDGLRGMALLLAGIGISLDEAAVGFSFGLLGLPIVWTSVLILVQALVFAAIGLSFGRWLKPLLGEAAEKATGIVLIALALWMAVERWLF